MRLSQILFFLISLVIVFSASAAKENIRVEINETGQLTGMTRYGFINDKDPENVPSAPRRREYFRAARATIVEEMEKKGYELVEKSEAEFLLEFTGMGILVPRLGRSNVENYRGMPIPGTVSVNTNVDGTQGLLRILASLPGKSNKVWTVTGTLDVGTGPKQTIRRINKLIRHLFRQFPDSTVK